MDFQPQASCTEYDLEKTHTNINKDYLWTPVQYTRTHALQFQR